jgi:dienelactone hydrolase
MRRYLLGLLVLILTLASVTASNLNPTSAQSGVFVTTRDSMNLRLGAGREHSVVAVVPFNTRLPALSRSADSAWIRVDYNGQIGWLSAEFLNIEGDANALPVGDAPIPVNNPGNSGNPTDPNVPPAASNNGAIIELSGLAETPDTRYYRLIYTSDGLRITGYLAEPKAEGQHPAVIYNRGGHTEGGWVTPVDIAPFAEAGYVVVASQYRGCCGGEGRDEFGGADVNDVIALINTLKSRPNVDPNRIAMFGSSRGAMMTYIALRRQTEARTSDIKVAATTSGLSDLFMWAQQRPDLDVGFYLTTVGASTTSDPAAFRARSATYWASSIRVPILIMHGDADYEVSVQQSIRLARAIGRRAQLIIYPGDDHGLHGNQGGYPAAMRFFQRYLSRNGEDRTWETHADKITHAFEVLRPR